MELVLVAWYVLVSEKEKERKKQDAKSWFAGNVYNNYTIYRIQRSIEVSW